MNGLARAPVRTGRACAPVRARVINAASDASPNAPLTRRDVDMVTKHEDFGMHDNPLRQHKVS